MRISSPGSRAIRLDTNRGVSMKSLASIDSHFVCRQAWLENPKSMRKTSAKPAKYQSDFEKSLAFRLTLLVAVFVIGLNLLSPDPTPDRPTHAVVRLTV